VKVTIAAIGKLKAGAERDLAARYIDRANAGGRRLGLTVTVRELPEGRAANPATRKDDEADALVGGLATGALLIALDERGRALDSPAFAARLADWRDTGTADLVLAIGGADGHGKAVLDRAALRLSFGAMTWPHQLVRVMVAEQLYRAVTILSGHPYHRE
jgi:23S rRNA (pseudouridine1915-N3)-methyltransferase